MKKTKKNTINLNARTLFKFKRSTVSLAGSGDTSLTTVGTVSSAVGIGKR